MVVQMISVGEATGAMDAMLNKIADFYDDEVDDAVGALTSMMEPMLMVFLGTTGGWACCCHVPADLQACRRSRRLAMLDKKQLFWFIFFRVVVVSFFLVSTIILNINEPDSSQVSLFRGLSRLIIATYAFSIVSLLVLKFSANPSLALTYAQIIWDLLLVTFLLIFTGGINSPYSFLYFLSIINASVFLTRREAYYTASLCGILYGGIIDLQYFGNLTLLGLSQYPAQQYGLRYTFYTIFLNIAAYYLTAFLAGHLSERARASETALHEKLVNYEELERLNSSIVATINIGLLTINETGQDQGLQPLCRAFDWRYPVGCI